MDIVKPMLAATCEDITNLKFPLLATPKLDGIRCLVIDGKAVSRKLKPIPNHHIRNLIERYCPNGFDGEIMIPGASFNEVQSLVMTEEGTPTFEYHVFDWLRSNVEEHYRIRIDNLAAWFQGASVRFLRPCLPMAVDNINHLNLLEESWLSEGYEGVMVRVPHGPYKFGRSTVREGYLLKIKRFADSEAEVIGFEEQLSNQNEAQKDELGHTKRSSHKANLVPAGTLGTLLVRDVATRVEFGIGTGMDAAMRQEIWNNRGQYLGKLVTYKHQPSGALEGGRPRFPVFKGFRDKRDL